MKKSVRLTKLACYNGYLAQAICVNFVPLLFVTFQNEFALSYSAISVLIIVNFTTELLIDLGTSKWAGAMNLRFFSVFAHVSTVLGLVGLSTLPYLMSPFPALVISEILLGAGGGFIEVMVSPIIEACPTDNKSGNMALLHGFFCWGSAGVIALSSLYFILFDLETTWRILPLIAAVCPLIGIFLFSFAPLYRLPEGDKTKGEKGGRGLVFLFFLLMFAAGATELCVSQWASAFAEEGLGVSKALGDLLGPCLFALCMGTSRTFYGINAGKLDLPRYMLTGGILSVVAYLLCALSPWAPLSLAGCALAGLGVGILWPGTLSIAAKAVPKGGVGFFAFLALAGDLGCLSCPALSGVFADLIGLKYSFLPMLFCPLLCVTLVLILRRHKAVRAALGKDGKEVPHE